MEELRLNHVYEGHALEVLRNFPDGSIDSCVTSPPYFGLRDYGTDPLMWGGDPECDHQWGKALRNIGHKAGNKFASTGFQQHAEVAKFGGLAQLGEERKSNICTECGAWRGHLGGEPTPELYIKHLKDILSEVHRVLKPWGSLFLNIGDSFVGGGQWWGTDPEIMSEIQRHNRGSLHNKGEPVGFRVKGLKSKDLMGVPWRTALAMQGFAVVSGTDLVGVADLMQYARQDGNWDTIEEVERMVRTWAEVAKIVDPYWLRMDVIWCLSGGTWLYVRTRKNGECVMMLRDLRRLKVQEVELWSGEGWVRLRGISKTRRNGDEIEFVLRSGENISCTPAHRFPTRRGLVSASELRVGDVLDTCRLPEPDTPLDCALDIDAAWFAGLYLAEGSRSGRTIQITGHIKEEERYRRVRTIARKYGGSVSRWTKRNTMKISVYGNVMNAIVDEFVSGRIAKDKCFSAKVWRYSNAFIGAMLSGYLHGDGHWDAKNGRWRLNFTRNYNLERDLRIACARLGHKISLRPLHVKYKGKFRPTFHGEIRFLTSEHWATKDMGEIVAIRKAGCRELYDIGVDGDSHVFALASGVLTHNSKKNAMPESVNNRPTSAHEYIFMFVKRADGPMFWRHENGVATSTRPKPDYRWRLREPAKRRVNRRDEGELLETEREEIDYMETSEMPEGWDKNKEVHRKWSRSNLWEGIYYYYDMEATKQPYKALGKPRQFGKSGNKDRNDTLREYEAQDMGGANMRSVWEMCTKSYKGPHYAAFPEELPKRCILASTSEKGNCSKCGKPWVRTMQVLERAGHKSRIDEDKFKCGSGHHRSSTKSFVGWHPTCKCDAETVPALVLDPFCGTGTTLKVATSLGRNFVGIDLSRDYVEKQAKTRTAQRGIHEVGSSATYSKETGTKQGSKGVPPKTRKSFRRDRAPVTPT